MFKQITPVIIVVVSLSLFAMLPPIDFSSTRSEDSIALGIGNNTFSCHFNGEKWTDSKSVQAELGFENGYLYLVLWLGNEYNERVYFVTKTDQLRTGTYELDEPGSKYMAIQRHADQCDFVTDAYYGGRLMIHTYDPVRNIVAGTFECLAFSESCNEVIRVTDGKFDVTYRMH